MRRIAVAVMVLALGAPATAAEWTTVRIGTEGAYPPFNFFDSAGNLQGFDVDIARALCERMQVECTFVAQDWDGIIPALLEGKYDAIVASMSITEERKQSVAFTNKYYNTPARLVIAEDRVNEFFGSGIAGKVIGVQSSTIHANFLTDNYGEVIEIRQYRTQEEANADLAAGRIDGVLADSIALLEGFLNTEGGAGFVFFGPEFSDPRWFGEGAGIALRKEDTDLAELFNRALAEIRADGTYAEINSRYFPFDIYGEEVSQ